MKRLLLLLVLAGSCPVAQQDTRITCLATQASVQDIVRSMAAQAGLGYDWQKSFDQTNPMCRRWVRDVRIEAVPFEMQCIGFCVPGLRYEVENGVVVLFLGTDSERERHGVRSVLG